MQGGIVHAKAVVLQDEVANQAYRQTNLSPPPPPQCYATQVARTPFFRSQNQWYTENDVNKYIRLKRKLPQCLTPPAAFLHNEFKTRKMLKRKTVANKNILLRNMSFQLQHTH
jgi:hypothetical protein